MRQLTRQKSIQSASTIEILFSRTVGAAIKDLYRQTAQMNHYWRAAQPGERKKRRLFGVLDSSPSFVWIRKRWGREESAAAAAFYINGMHIPLLPVA